MSYARPETGGACDVERFTYVVRGEIQRDEPREKSISVSGTLLVSVSESSSVVDCTPDLMQVATPGAELAHAAFSARSDQFALDVPTMVIGGHRPSIRVAALLDENENGTCDDGEPTGSIEVDDIDELGALAIALSRDGCSERL